jgi:hypothetical protein
LSSERKTGVRYGARQEGERREDREDEMMELLK